MNTAKRKTIVKRAGSQVVKPSGSVDKTVAAVSYKPGSLLERRGGMVTTVRLGKRASTKAI